MKPHLALVVAALAASPACAADTPYVLYATGKYDAAIKAGTAEDDAQGFAVAARAALADATTRDKPCLDCLKRAEAFARKAVAADAKVPDGNTFLAVSLGYEARLVGPVFARLHNYPDEAKERLDKALADDPKNAWALGALGGWNIEIVRTGGAYLGNWIYGATEEKGLDAFAQAFKSAPDNLSVRYQYGLSLSGYDADRFQSQILDAFARVGRLTPQTAYERIAQARAAELLALWKKGDRKTFDARVRKYQGYP
jgi:hypothetical protein